MEPREVSATIDAETADRRRQLQNGGSELEPLERVSLLQVFREECAVWYKWREDPCAKGRLGVYIALRYRHSKAAFKKWLPRIDAILDAAEAEVRAATVPAEEKPFYEWPEPQYGGG
jgi:hypothetical protein